MQMTSRLWHGRPWQAHWCQGGESHKDSPSPLPCLCREEHSHLTTRVVKNRKKIPQSVEPCGQERCPPMFSHNDIIHEDDDLPWLQEKWMEKIADLVGGIPLELPPLQEVNHQINPINPDKEIQYWLPKCPKHFCEELSTKLEWYTTAKWWITTVTPQVVPMLCVLKKNSMLCTVFNLHLQKKIPWRMLLPSWTKTSSTVIWHAADTK